MKFRSSSTKNRKAAVSGQFYSGNKADLKKQLRDLFQSVETNVIEGAKQQGYLQALISPHAGYLFSGKVAAAAYAQIPDNKIYKKVFVLASSHRYYFNGASIFCTGNYETPLGEIKVDTELGKSLISKSKVFENKPEVHEDEHSLEVQLPFLQYKLKYNFQLVPIIIGTNNATTCKQIAKELEPYFTAENLFIISSDFSHFPAYNDALKVDEQTMQSICSNHPENLLATLEDHKNANIGDLATSLCGWTSVLTLMNLSHQKRFEYQKMKYLNSGDSKTYGDKNRVVGYWSIAVYGKSAAFTISDKEKTAILKIARDTITSYFESNTNKKTKKELISGVLAKKAGVFVSVYINDELRGCIGNFSGDKTLNELVQKMSVSAICDSRFENVKKEELDYLELEVSVLSPLKMIHSKDEIVLGRHGIYIKQNFNSGTFLPQVATKTAWNVEQFLGHCSRDKAGLGWDGWKSAEVFTYEAIVFRG